jgi:hypothetical protein
MRFIGLLTAAAVLCLSGQAFAQQGDAAAPAAPTDAAQKAIDDAYLGRCQANAPKALCDCVVQVAGSEIDDPAERQVFFDFMMGDVDKAKTARGMFSPQKNSAFNAKLQRADMMLGDRCDKLKPQKPQ